MIGRLRGTRLRLIHGVVIAAGALLLLKGLSLLLSVEADPAGPDGLPPFARVLAYARTNYIPPEPSTTGSVAAGEKAGAEPAPDARPGATRPEQARSPSQRAIEERLRERREELQQRSRDLETREKLLEEAERKLDVRAADAAASGSAKTPRDPNVDPSTEGAAVKSLVIMYETMKPKEAARVFDRLPQDVLVPVVRRMNPRKMAEILGAMSPEKAEKLTVALARPAMKTSNPGPASSLDLPPGELPAIDPPQPAPGAPRPGT